MSNPNEQPQTSAPVWDPPDEFTANVRNHHLDMVAQTGWELWDELKPEAKQVWRETVAFASAPYRNELRDVKAEMEATVHRLSGLEEAARKDFLQAQEALLRAGFVYTHGAKFPWKPTVKAERSGRRGDWLDAMDNLDKALAEVKLLNEQLAITEASRNEWQAKAERFQKESYELHRRFGRATKRSNGYVRELRRAKAALNRAGFSYHPGGAVEWKPPANMAAQKLNNLDRYSIDKMAIAAQKQTGTLTVDWWRNAVASIRAWVMNEAPLNRWGYQVDEWMNWDDDWDDDDPQVDPLDGLRNAALGQATVTIENHLEKALSTVKAKIGDIVRETLEEMTLAPYTKSESKTDTKSE